MHRIKPNECNQRKENKKVNADSAEYKKEYCINNTDKANILTQRKREHKQQRKWEYKQKME